MASPSPQNKPSLCLLLSTSSSPLLSSCISPFAALQTLHLRAFVRAVPSVWNAIPTDIYLSYSFPSSLYSERALLTTSYKTPPPNLLCCFIFSTAFINI